MKITDRNLRNLGIVRQILYLHIYLIELITKGYFSPIELFKFIIRFRNLNYQVWSYFCWMEEWANNLNRYSPYITRFNHLLEIPKLERWFRTDPNPSRQKLINYMNVLNGSSYRRHNVKVTYQQICNWFANQRAANRFCVFLLKFTFSMIKIIKNRGLLPTVTKSENIEEICKMLNCTAITYNWISGG